MSETKRQNVIKQLTETIGEEAAEALMESIPPFDWHQIATKDDLGRALQALTAEVNGQFAQVRGEIRRVEGELSIAIAALAEKLAEQTAAHSTEMRGLAEKLAEQTAAHSTEMAAMSDRISGKVDRAVHWAAGAVVAVAVAVAGAAATGAAPFG